MTRPALIGLMLMTGATYALEAQEAALAEVRHAFLVPADALSGDRAVVVCLEERLPKLTVLSVAETKERADVVLTIAAKMHDSLATSLLFGNSVRPEADIIATTPAGVRLWKGHTRLAAIRQKADTAAETAACDLADQIGAEVMRAMKKARDSR